MLVLTLFIILLESVLLKLKNEFTFELECAAVDDICIQDYIHLEVIRGFVSDEVGEKFVHTTIWGVTDRVILLKQNVVLPIPNCP